MTLRAREFVNAGWWPRLLLATPLLCCGMMVGQGPGNQPRMVLQALDTDRDGKLSASEVKAAPAALGTLDRNGDGTLTLDEVQPRPEHAGASADELTQQLMQFDKNGDGGLTHEELPARMQNLFQRGDSNHDGRLTADEIRAMAAHQGMPAGTPANRGGGAMRNDPLLSALDINHDGVIDAAEIAAASPSLQALDKNGDGEIGPEEMRPRQQTPEERTNHLLGEWDTNGDGRISKAEAPDRLQQQFESIDKNGDGLLEKAELLQFFSTASDHPRGSGVTQEGTPGPKPRSQEQAQ